MDIFQLVTKNSGYALIGVEKLLWETFFPCLFFGKWKYISPIVGTLSNMPVKKSGMVLQIPVMSANGNFLSLQRARTELIRDVTIEREFLTANRLQEVKEEKSEG